MRVRMGAAAAAVLVATVAGAATRSGRFTVEHTIAPGRTLQVEASSLDVRVEIGGDAVRGTVEVRATAPAARLDDLVESARPRWIEGGDRLVLRVRPRARGWWPLGGERLRGRLELRVPAGVHLVVDTSSGDVEVAGDLGEGRLAVDTASGDVAVRGPAAELVVDTASGDVLIEGEDELPAASVDTASGDVLVAAPVGELRVDTASGDLTVRGRLGSLVASSASGDVVASSLRGGAEVETASGDVHLAWTELGPETRVEVDTASGEVRVDLPEGSAPAGTVVTSSGEIRCRFPARSERRGRRLVLAGGGPPAVDIRTMSGDVTLARR